MHMSLLLITHTKPTASEIEKIMEPYHSDYHGFMDWYVIGGRFSGLLTEIEVDPEQLKNFFEQVKKQKMDYVGGTERMTEDLQRERTHKLWRKIFGDKWKTEEIPMWRDNYNKIGYADDSQPVGNFTQLQLNRLSTYTVMKVEDEDYVKVSHQEVWNGDDFLTDHDWSKKYYERFLSKLNPTDYLTIIDYHN